MATPRLSIIVPALDEETRIADTLSGLQPLRATGHEVIVVDGGSRDATREHARALADDVIVAPRGRARQMNHGAAQARHDVLVFVHADTTLPPRPDAAIAAALALGYHWGRFDVHLDGRSRLLPVVAQLMNVRSRLTGIATGDQAIFVEREAFAAAGGYPDIALMEDVALSARLRRLAGRCACLREHVITSGRRWDERGALRTIASMWTLRFDYRRGVDPAQLARRYYAQPPPALLIFAKDPQPGAVKTRLAAAVGDDRAAAIYRELVDRTLRTATLARRAGIVGDVILCGTPRTDTPAFTRWHRDFGVALQPQGAGELGQRMRSALAAAIARGTPALLIGTDVPALDERYLAQAATALQCNDAVFGPAEDGGYVLVGLRRDIDAFSGVAWSGPLVMEQTRELLFGARAEWHELPTLWDVDRATDLERWERLRV